jgi:hypothetical protein
MVLLNPNMKCSNFEHGDIVDELHGLYEGICKLDYNINCVNCWYTAMNNLFPV